LVKRRPVEAGPILLWFRDDLRLTDHPGVTAAVRRNVPIIPLFILDETEPLRRMGGASRWWLHRSLAALDSELRQRRSRLVLRRGSAARIVADLAAEVGASAVYWSRSYEPREREREGRIRTMLGERGMEVRTFLANMLAEPTEFTKKDGGPFQVFTPFWRALRARVRPVSPLPAPKHVLAPATWPDTETLDFWRLLPTHPNWAKGFEIWTPGQAGAKEQLTQFVDSTLNGYSVGRDHPGLPHTSRLSPHLHFGELSVASAWRNVLAATAEGRAPEQDGEAFLKELAWRDFSRHLLFHFPNLPEVPWRQEFARFPWRSDPKGLDAWKRGLTGYPIVDAGMRELWSTGWMHNRVRMIVASFLTKHLLLPWQEGEAWFWDTLVDADLANNAANWQWVAGSGADAAPYFRIFNPVLQGERFDPEGAYVRQWVPELAELPPSAIHRPWEYGLLQAAREYPRPIVDHHTARRRALEAYERVTARRG
jgi:deoxyribodipyrimidine photo-lyase